MDYNKSINLPKTAFPMRAGLPKREPGMLENWKTLDLYNAILEKNQNGPRFVLHDGPPFSNGNLHMGHALNKTLKDFIVRSYAMRGYYTPYIPGWDNHGMPIESAIIKQNKLNRKAMSVPQFRSACEEFARHYMDVQSDSFQRLGIIGDWEHPYATMDKSFESEEVRVFGEMFKKGYIYKGLKPVYWCPKDETALAEAEIEYQDDACTSIYVKFAIKDDLGKLNGFDLSNTYFIIWTTTTWTLPGNLAIALHPRDSYVLAKASNGETYVTAEALLEKTMAMAGITEYEIMATHEGAFFEHMLTQHPFLPRTSQLVLADYVTMETGTGCVHTAPGFGADDYQTCLKYGIDLIVPVDDQGKQTADAGKFEGMRYDDSNAAILADLKETGALFASEEMTHSYPHCWRCKGPIIFRATPQWFCSVDAFKDDAVDACDEVRWVPQWGKDRMVSMIRERNDWCISRQRKWGLPIPVVYCKHCEKPIVNDVTIDAISDMFGAEGSNAWFEKDTTDFLPTDFACPHCGQSKGFIKEEDTLDGWFDSGSSHASFLQKENPQNWPATMYIEGLDQYRGWFQAAMLTSVGALGKGAPFKECLTHGWTVDGDGRAMHKSLGNGIDPADILRDFGADLIRLWSASADYHVDVRCSKNIFTQLSQNYLKFRNTARYCLGNLNGFNANDLLKPSEMQELDLWAITKLNGLIETAAKAYDNYEFHTITHAINDFCVVDLSSFYLDIIKDRLYCEDANGSKRRSAQTALYLILDTMTRMFAPILSFTCDEIWQEMPHAEGDDLRNVALNMMNKPFAQYALSHEDMAKWSTITTLRGDINAVLEGARADKKIGKALEAQLVLFPSDEASKNALDAVAKMNLAELFIVSGCAIADSQPTDGTLGNGIALTGLHIAVTQASGVKCPRCWMHKESTSEDGLCPRCANVVANLPSVEA